MYRSTNQGVRIDPLDQKWAGEAGAGGGRVGGSSTQSMPSIPLSLSEWYFTICPTPYNRK